MTATYQVRATVEVEDVSALYEAAREACRQGEGMTKEASIAMIGTADEPNVEGCIQATVIVWASPDGIQVEDEEVEHLFGTWELEE